MGERGASPVGVIAAFLFVCTAPLVAVVATGMADEQPAADHSETASDSSTTLTSAPPDSGPPGTGTADIPPGETTETAETAETTAGRAPTPTIPETTAAPTTTTTSRRLEPPPTTSRRAPTPAEQVVDMVNEARAKVPNCPALRVEAHLTIAAQSHSDDMAARNYFSHDTPEGVGFADRVKAAGYPRPGGENIAKGQRTAEQVMTDWLASAGHRANILNCTFRAIGVGVNDTVWTWTQDFGY